MICCASKLEVFEPHTGTFHVNNMNVVLMNMVGGSVVSHSHCLMINQFSLLVGDTIVYIRSAASYIYVPTSVFVPCSEHLRALHSASQSLGHQFTCIYAHQL